MSVPKQLLRKRLILGIGLGVGLYFGFKYLIPKLFPPKINTNVNFSNADGQSDDFVAQQYDASKNSTWISYKGSDVVGYWQQGKIKEGTVINQLT
jgi:hypothetical protein